MNKIYEVIMQDEYNNLYQLGFYKNLKDAVPDINDWLTAYDVSIKEDDLNEYVSTFSSAFDLDIGMLFEDNDDVSGVMVRGFVLTPEHLKIQE